MNKRVWLWSLGILAILVPIFVGAFLLLQVKNKVTLANFGKLQRGMQSDDVIRILGKPNSQRMMKGYIKGPDHIILTFDPSLRGMGDHLDFPCYSWDGEDLWITVEFSPDNKAIVLQHGLKPSSPRWSDRIFPRLRRLCGL